MFDKSKKDLRWLQEQLLAEEEPEEYEEAEYEDEEYEEYDEDLDLEDIDDLLSDGDDAPDEEPVYRNYANRYGRGQQKQFDYLEADEELEDDEFLYRDDYRRSKRKRKSRNIGWIIVAFLEVIAIAAIALWWLSWML